MPTIIASILYSSLFDINANKANSHLDNANCLTISPFAIDGNKLSSPKTMHGFWNHCFSLEISTLLPLCHQWQIILLKNPPKTLQPTLQLIPQTE